MQPTGEVKYETSMKILNDENDIHMKVIRFEKERLTYAHLKNINILLTCSTDDFDLPLTLGTPT